MAYHAQIPGFHGGSIGVEMFFTLSGFLITGVLLRPDALTRDGFKRFYVRRGLRLFPALVVAVGFCVVYASVVLGGHDRSFLLKESLTSLTYTTDFYLAQGHWSNNDWGSLGHTWSLGVEEQFYLAWPFALLLVLRLRTSRRLQAAIVLVVAAAAAAWRAYLSSRGLHTHIGFAFDTHIDVLLVGCALGLILPVSGARLRPAHQRAATIAALISLCILAFVTAFRPYLARFPLDTGYLIIALATAAMIVRLAVTPQSAVARRYVRAFSFGPVVWIGAISYGIYLWHVIVFAVYKHAFDIDTLGERAAFAPLLLLTTLAAATLSYYVVELPFLRLKDRRFQDRPVPRVEASVAEALYDAAEGTVAVEPGARPA